MAKNIIILNGSPRPKGNTSALTAEFKKGAEEAGNKVTEFQSFSYPECKSTDALAAGAVVKIRSIRVHREMTWRRYIHYIRKRMWWFLLRRYTTGLFLDF